MNSKNSNVEDRPIAILVDREGLGDVLLKLPLLRAIARGCPGRPIWWVATRTTEMAGPLRSFMPAEVAVVREEKARLEKPLRDVIRLRELPAFSLIFDTRTRIGSVWLARQVLAHEQFFCCLPGYLLSSARPAGRLARPRHIGMRALSLAQAAFGAKVDGSGELGCTQASQKARFMWASAWGAAKPARTGPLRALPSSRGVLPAARWRRFCYSGRRSARAPTRFARQFPPLPPSISPDRTQPASRSTSPSR
jgi:hypothetical protein